MAWIQDHITPERISIVRKLTALAQEMDLTTSQLAIAWILRRKEVSSVITGSTRLEQLDENLLASEASGKLNDEILERIEEIIQNIPE